MPRSIQPRPLSPVRPPTSRGFTLIELLVVLAVILVLAAILLPALQHARRQALSVKCLATLRDAHHAIQIYAQDNRGYYPMGALAPYTLGDRAHRIVYWYQLLAPYLQKDLAEPLDHLHNQIEHPQRWGCPAWSLDKARTFFADYITPFHHPTPTAGYGMNLYPTINYQNMKAGDSGPRGGVMNANFVANVGAPYPWLRQKDWTGPYSSQRVLLADSFLFAVFSHPIAGNNFPPAISPQYYRWPGSPVGMGSIGKTTIDLYRHGILPPPIDARQLNPSKGKISYNILYCDGHAENHSHGREAYYSFRLRFPG